MVAADSDESWPFRDGVTVYSKLRIDFPVVGSVVIMTLVIVISLAFNSVPADALIEAARPALNDAMTLSPFVNGTLSPARAFVN